MMKSRLTADVRNLLNAFAPFNKLPEAERLNGILDVLAELADEFGDLQVALDLIEGLENEE